jgi:hypothetical protein
MSEDARGAHKCHRCRPHNGTGSFRQDDSGEGPELETIDTTFAESGGEVFFTAATAPGRSRRSAPGRPAAAST